MDMNILIPISGLVALLFAGYLAFSILNKSKGTEKMQEISDAIRVGAMAYMKRQYTTVAIVTIILTIILGLVTGTPMAVGFVVGAVASAIAGYLGMNVSVRANVRTAEAAKTGIKEAKSQQLR